MITRARDEDNLDRAHRGRVSVEQEPADPQCPGKRAQIGTFAELVDYHRKVGSMTSNHEHHAESAARDLHEASKGQRETSAKLVALIGAGIVYALLTVAGAIRNK